MTTCTAILVALYAWGVLVVGLLLAVAITDEARPMRWSPGRLVSLAVLWPISVLLIFVLSAIQTRREAA